MRLKEIIELMKKHSTTILWYGEKSDQYPSIITGEAPIEMIWRLIRKRALKNNDSSGKIYLDQFLDNPKINGFVNITLYKMVLKKKDKYIELHGSLDEVYCDECKKTFNAAQALWIDNDAPRCSYCGGRLKPQVEPYRGKMGIKLEESIRLVMISELVLVFGESDSVEPASHLPCIAKNIG